MRTGICLKTTPSLNYTQAIIRLREKVKPETPMIEQAVSTSPLTKRAFSRRRFIGTGAAAAAFTAASWNRVAGANERVGIGVIGFGLIGRIHTRNFKSQSDAQIVGIAETYRPRLDAGAEFVGGSANKYGDFRRL